MKTKEIKLILEDGTEFTGKSFGYDTSVSGELGVAQIVGDVDKSQPVHDPVRRFLAAGNFEGHDGTARPHLPQRQRVLRMIFQ